MTEAIKTAELCVFCGASAAKTIYKTKLFGKGEKAIVIDNVPVRHCENCGENYYDPQVSQMIDETLAHPEKQTITRQIDVVSWAA